MRLRPWGWNPTGRRRWALLLLWAGHLAYVLMARGPGGPADFLASFIARPGLLMSGAVNSWSDSRSKRVSDLKRAEREILDLRSRLEYLQKQAIQNVQTVMEVEEAHRLLGLKKLFPIETTGARILANLRKAPFGGMILDKGQDRGLRVDQGIISPEGVIGRIWSVGPNQSSVLPLDAYNASTAVMLARSRATGVLQGTGPNRAEIRYISGQEVVQVGEPVYTSGLDRVFPRGLLVGYVSAVIPHEPELGLEVSLSAYLDRTHLVLVLPPSPPIQVAPPGLAALKAQDALKTGETNKSPIPQSVPAQKTINQEPGLKPGADQAGKP